MLLKSFMHFEIKIGSEKFLCGMAIPMEKKIKKKIKKCSSKVFFRTPRISLRKSSLAKSYVDKEGVDSIKQKNHTNSCGGGGFLKSGLPRAPSSTPL